MSNQHLFDKDSVLSTPEAFKPSAVSSTLAATTAADTSQAARKRQWGAIVIASLLVASLLIWGGMQLAFGLSSDQQQIQIIDGDGNTRLLPLSQNETYTFAASLGINVIEVQDGSVRMASSDCPNHDCVSQGSIDTAAQMIVCMPHQLIVGIVNQEESHS